MVDIQGRSRYGLYSAARRLACSSRTRFAGRQSTDTQTPQEIESPALCQIGTGKSHDLADGLPLLPGKAVVRAVPAGRLGVERAVQAPVYGIGQKLPAGRTITVSIQLRNPDGQVVRN